MNDAYVRTTMNVRLVAALAVIALLTGCSATVPIRPYMFIQKDQQPNAPHAEEVPADEDARVS